jgi:hypothetical protein
MGRVELRKVDVDVVTFGQYMRPTKRHMKVDRYVEPAEFDRWKQIAEGMGFLYVASGPLVRSSYKVGASYPRRLPESSDFSLRLANTLSRMYSAGREPKRGLRTSRLTRRVQMRSYLHDLWAACPRGRN